MTPIKVLFLDQSIKDGGGGRSLFYILKFIDKKKFHPVAMLPAEDGVLPERIKKEGICDLIQEPWLHSTNSMSRTPGNSRAKESGWERLRSRMLNYFDLWRLILVRLPTLVHDEKIQILYANNALTRIITLVVGIMTDVKVVWHIRNVKRGWWYSLMSHFSAVTKIIFISKAQQKLFRIPEAKSSIIYNGIDLAEFSRARITGQLRKELNIPPTARVFGVTGRMVPKKGYLSFLAASKLLSEKVHLDCRFVIVGGAFSPSQEAYLDELQKYCVSQNMESLVHFIGFKKDVKPYLIDMDALIVPSEWEEPFGRTAIEAMALGIPVVAYRVGGLPEVLNETCGILCQKSNSIELSHAMEKIATGKAGNIGTAGRFKVENEFDVIKITAQVERLLFEI